MSGIFLSYRRDDSAGHAGRLYDRLAQHFGQDHIFRDIDSLSYGTEFLPAIRDALEMSDVLVAVIGREWVTVTKADGVRRLDDPRDFVRLEIAAALERNIPVLPVLVEGAEMPDEADLPLPLVRLAQYNGLEVSDSRWDFDVGRLVAALERWTPRAPAPPGPMPGPPPPERSRSDSAPAPRPPPPSGAPRRSSAGTVRPPGLPKRVLYSIAAAVALLGLAGGVLLFGGGGDGSSGGGSSGERGGGSDSGASRTRAVIVPGTEPWTDSGLDVTAGERVHITAGGVVYHGGGDSSAGPDGSGDAGLRKFNVLSDANHAGLIGRVGDGGLPFVVGSESSFTARASGRLYLGINDLGVDNNAGGFTVTVEADPGP